MVVAYEQPRSYRSFPRRTTESSGGEDRHLLCGELGERKQESRVQSQEDLDDLEERLRNGRVLGALLVPPTTGITAEHHRFVPIEGCSPVYGKPAYEIVSPRLFLPLVEAERAAWAEEACWIVARRLGMVDLVPCTVVRRMYWPSLGRVATVALQVLWSDAKKPFPIRSCAQNDLARAAVFDALVLNSDRHGGNWMGEAGPPLQLRLIDHSFTFGVNGRRFRSELADLWNNRALPPDIVDAVTDLLLDPPAVLVDLVGVDQYRAFLGRAQMIATRGRYKTAELRAA